MTCKKQDKSQKDSLIIIKNLTWANLNKKGVCLLCYFFLLPRSASQMLTRCNKGDNFYCCTELYIVIIM